MKCSSCGTPVYTLPIPGKATICAGCYQDAHADPERYAGIYPNNPSYDLPDPDPPLGLDVF